MDNAFAHLGRSELLAVLAAAVAQLAGGEQPTVISPEIAAVVEGRATLALALPQWMTAEGQARGVRVQAWSYAQRRQAEQLATDRRPNASTFGQIDDWRRMAEEVRLGILEPAGLTLAIVESWGYDVVASIHQQIERLGPIPPAILAAELAALVGAPAPPVGGPSGARGDDPGPHPHDLGGDAATDEGLA